MITKKEKAEIDRRIIGVYDSLIELEEQKLNDTRTLIILFIMMIIVIGAMIIFDRFLR